MDKSQDLNAFINSDAENLDKFEQFLIQEGLKHQIEFVLAVRGFKQSEPLHHLGQIIRTIYKHYFDVIKISDGVRATVKQKVTSRSYTLDIFDQALEEVWDFLDKIVYKEFLNHVNQQSVNLDYHDYHSAQTKSVASSSNSSSNCNIAAANAIFNNGGSATSSSNNHNNTNTTNLNNSVSVQLLQPSSLSSLPNVSVPGVNPESCHSNNNSNSGSSSSSSNHGNSLSASLTTTTSTNVPVLPPPSSTLVPTTTIHPSDPVSAISSSSSSTSAANIGIINNNNIKFQQQSQNVLLPHSSQAQKISIPLSSSSSSSAVTVIPKIVSSASLEPLIEGQEFRQPSSSVSSSSQQNPVVGLTREALLATQKQRCAQVDCMPLSLSKQKPKFPYHYANYNSYNPVSRVDSEVQSFSSGYTDSECGEVRSKRKKKEELNCDNLPSLRHHIKNTDIRCPKKDGSCQNMDPQTFANLLIQKLLDVKRKREAEEQMNKRLSEEISQALRDKLLVSSSAAGHVDEVQPDDILSEHVSRVFSEVTPDSSGRSSREYSKRNKCTVNPILRSRIHNKEPEHQIPKSRTFPSTSNKYNDDSGISITTTSTSDDLNSHLAQWLNNSVGMNHNVSSGKPNSKSNPAKTKKREISCVVYYEDKNHHRKEPYCYKMTTSSNVSLSMFKDYLPKKGSYRYFFRYDGVDGTVREEITKDDAVIPMFDDYKIVAYLKDS